MQKKLLKVIIIVSVIIICLKLFSDNMPEYGIKSWWQKLVLKVLIDDKVPKTSVAEAAAKKDSFLFLDTRSKEEYNVSHIANARYVGYKDFNIAKVEDLPKNLPLVVYCAVGKRSNEVAKKLMNAGFKNVQNMYGGIFEWVNEGHEIVNKNNLPTDTIHGYNHFFGLWLKRGKKVY